MAELSKRMRAVADFVPAGCVAADIGCDHGFVSIYLVRQGICPRVFAADVRTGPLARAKEHIAQAGLYDYITTVLSDGVKEVPIGCAGGAETIIAAGMGGKLIVRILSDVPQKTRALRCAVLQPQSEIALVRRWLSQNRFVIAAETMVYEEGKYYPVLLAYNDRFPENAEAVSRAKKRHEVLTGRMDKAGFSPQQCREAMEWLGEGLIAGKSPVLSAFLLHTMEKDRELLEKMPPLEEMPSGVRDCDVKEGSDGGRVAKRREELSGRIALAGKVLELMDA